jgi:hypothetical protein
VLIVADRTIGGYFGLGKHIWSLHAYQMRQITIVRASLDLPIHLLKLNIDHICIRLHLCMECMYHQILHPRPLPSYLWPVVDGLVLRCPDHRLSDH